MGASKTDFRLHRNKDCRNQFMKMKDITYHPRGKDVNFGGKVVQRGREGRFDYPRPRSQPARNTITIELVQTLTKVIKKTEQP